MNGGLSMQKASDKKILQQILEAKCSDPHSFLGAHRYTDGKGGGLIIRVYIPAARSVELITESDEAVSGDAFQASHKMKKRRTPGLFELTFPGMVDFLKYKLKVTMSSGHTFETYDSYHFLPTISDYDLYLYNEGNYHRAYEKLGAHLRSIDGIDGTSFAVWAPEAVRVSVVGSFNDWDGRRHQMRRIGSSGVWEIFLPGIGQGDYYKYEILTANGTINLKSDPFAFRTELRPKNASIVHQIQGYQWKDQAWIEQRSRSDMLEKPISIYEVHLGSWARADNEGGRWLTYREFAEKLVTYVLDMGYTHIELMPIAEHPHDPSWGYQVTGYYSATSRYGSPEDLMYFIDTCHRNCIGVIMDWVPAHFPKDPHGLVRFDGSALYEHSDPRRGEHPDWGTLIFNYGRNEVRNFLISNAMFWLDVYHFDGLRVDAVASMLYLDYGRKAGEWLPNKFGGRENLEAIEFLKQLNSTVYSYFPGIMMIAEESTAWTMVTRPPYMGGLGFSFKWNMGWMNDYLRYISLDPVYRKFHHNDLTFSIMYAHSENFVLVLSHDEVVYGKRSMINKIYGGYRQKFAGLRVSYGFMYGHPGKKLLFMGGEFGQFNEWDYNSSLDWNLLDYEQHKKLRAYVRELNLLYKNEKSLSEADYSGTGFEWIDCKDSDHSVVSFIRRAKDPKDILIFVCNFTAVTYRDYRLGVPFNAYYEEVLNSDSEFFGGDNIGNMGGVSSESTPFHDRPHSVVIQLPPLSTVILRPKV